MHPSHLNIWVLIHLEFEPGPSRFKPSTLTTTPQENFNSRKIVDSVLKLWAVIITEAKQYSTHGLHYIISTGLLGCGLIISGYWSWM